MNQNFERTQSSKTLRTEEELKALRKRKGKLNKTLRGGRTDWDGMERDEA